MPSLIVSPIAAATVLVAAAAIAIVLALQTGNAGRITVQDAHAAVDDAATDRVNIFLTLVNDGGDDRLVDLRVPVADRVALVDAGAQPQAGLDLPGGASVTLSPEGPHVAVDGATWSADAEGRPTLALTLIFANSEGIMINVPQDASAPPAE